MANKNFVYQIHQIVFGVLCFTLPFERAISAVPNILLVLLGLLSFILIKKEALINLIIKEKSYQALLALVLSVFLLSLANGEFSNDFFFLKKIIIPCLLILFAIPVKDIDVFKKIFIFSVLFAVLISVSNIIQHINSTGEFKFSEGNYINGLMVSDRLYIGFCSVISLVFSLDFYRNNTARKLLKKLFLVNALLLIVFLFLVAARIAIISSIIVLLYFISIEFKLKQKIVIVVSLIIFSTIFFALNKNLTKRFLHLGDTYRSSFMQKIKTHEPRYDIWKCSMSIVNNNHDLFFGRGYKNTKNQLVDCYSSIIIEQQRKDWFVSSEFNTHNQFLDIFLGSGAIVLLLFLSLFYFLLRKGNCSFITISLLSILFFMMLIENIFHRQIGCFLFSLVFIVILKQKSAKTNVKSGSTAIYN